MVTGLHVVRMSVRSSDPALYDLWCSAFVELYPVAVYRAWDISVWKFVRDSLKWRTLENRVRCLGTKPPIILKHTIFQTCIYICIRFLLEQSLSDRLQKNCMWFVNMLRYWFYLIKRFSYFQIQTIYLGGNIEKYNSNSCKRPGTILFCLL